MHYCKLKPPQEMGHKEEQWQVHDVYIVHIVVCQRYLSGRRTGHAI